MKKLFGLALVALLVLGVPVFAHSEPLPDPGTTPDSALYFLDVALDNIGTALTFNSDARIERRLRVAEERLSEVRTMGLAGNVDAMRRAQSEHSEELSELKEEIKEVEDGTVEEELRKEIEIEREIRTH